MLHHIERDVDRIAALRHTHGRRFAHGAPIREVVRQHDACRARPFGTDAPVERRRRRKHRDRDAWKLARKRAPTSNKSEARDKRKHEREHTSMNHAPSYAGRPPLFHRSFQKGRPSTSSG